MFIILKISKHLKHGKYINYQHNIKFGKLQIAACYNPVLSSKIFCQGKR